MTQAAETGQRRRAMRAVMALSLLTLAGVFIALGIWQLERRAWKHALIAAVDSRSHAPPVPPPSPVQWPRITAERDAYLRVRARGRFLPDRRTLVQAVTDLGPGYWVIAPLDTGRFTLLVNRGFIPQARRTSPPAEPRGTVTVTGLLRITEPEGGFLRSNDTAANRWYSRDVAAIARARGLPALTAPYFIDADASGNTGTSMGTSTGGQPVGGLTVVHFADSHMSYALTWFAMAALSGWALWWVMRGREDAAG